MMRLKMVFIAALRVTLLAFPWSGGHAAGASAHSGKFKIVLSNNYMGNEWRPQMENVAKFISRSSRYKGLVDLEIDNSGPTPTDQIQSLQSIIRRWPSAILIDAASATALKGWMWGPRPRSFMWSPISPPAARR